MAQFARAGNRVEPPQLLAGLRIERGELAADSALSARESREHPTVGIDRGPGRAPAIAGDFDVPDGLARSLIERDEAPAGLPAEHLALGDRHATVLLLAVLRLVFPHEGTGRGVEGDHVA